MDRLRYAGMEKRPEHDRRPVIWQIAARRNTYHHSSKRGVLYKARRKIEEVKAQVQAKVEHPFRVIKRQFGYVKTRFRGLARNTAQLTTRLPCRICEWCAGIIARYGRGAPVRADNQGFALVIQ